MSNKTAVVTGASTGIGLETARGLAALDMRVVMVSRDSVRATVALDDVRATTGNPNVESLTADFESVSDIRRLARELRARLPRLDILINNAGIIPTERRLTGDGIEASLAVNHVAHQVLTLELLDLLKASAPARVVMLIGKAAPIDMNDLNYEHAYVGMTAYSRAKYASMLFLTALDRQLAGTGVTVNGAFPGLVDTPSARGITGRSLPNRLMWKLMGKPATQGCKAPLWVATSPGLEGTSGGLYGNGKSIPGFLKPKGWDDPALSARIWEQTERLIGTR